MDHQGDVASLIRDLRKQKGQSLRSAARDLGVDPSHLARVESGEKALSASLGDRLSDYYDVNPDHVYIAAGRIPPDIVGILLQHPEEFEAMRKRYGPHV